MTRLGDIARVEEAPEEDRRLFRGNGMDQIGLAVTRQAQSNDLAISDGVRKMIDEIRPSLPPGVTLEIARQNLGACAAVHSNMVLALPDPATMAELSDLEKRAAARMQYYQEKESGYSAIQKTRPQTIGYALTDSPVGQMAWIAEKFHGWTDCGHEPGGQSVGGHPEKALPKDAMLDTISRYWLTASAASSCRSSARSRIRPTT